MKKIGVYNVQSDDERMLQRLKFYGIGNKNDYILSQTKLENSQKITISYMGAYAGDYYILKNLEE